MTIDNINQKSERKKSMFHSVKDTPLLRWVYLTFVIGAKIILRIDISFDISDLLCTQYIY